MIVLSMVNGNTMTTPKGEYVIIIDENSDIDTNEENELNKLTLEEHFEYYKKIES